MVGAISAKGDPNTLPPELKDFINSSGGHGFMCLYYIMGLYYI